MQPQQSTETPVISAPDRAPKTNRPGLRIGNRVLSRFQLGAFIFIFACIGTYFIVRSFASTPSVYYVDCSSAASDTNSGTSVDTPLRSLAKASTIPLTPGSQLLLKRGCTWTDSLKANWVGTATSPITVGAYGDQTQPMPVITANATNNGTVAISGSYLIIENIFTQGQAPAVAAFCNNNPVGYIVGFSLNSGSNNNILRNVKASGNYAGVFIKQGSDHNHVLNSQFINNTMMNPLDPKSVNPNNDAGAFGVALGGDDNEIAGNTINGQYACSEDYNGDGSAVEVYGGQRNYIHHNKAADNEAFTELGNARSADNVYAYNQVTSSITTSNFLITRGSMDSFGPVAGTKAYNNTVYFTGAGSSGIVCFKGCSSTILSAKNNIIWTGGQPLYADAAFDEGNNIYWKTGGITSVNGPIAPSSQLVDPKFVNVGSFDFHLQTGSPAIDRGVNLNYTTDLDNATVPYGSAPDIGVFEFGSTGTGTTTDTTKPSAPVLTVTPGDQQVALSWTAATDNVGVTRYAVWRDSTWVAGLADTARSYTVTGLTNGTTYNLRVVAYDAAGNYQNSNIVSLVPASTTVPPTPADTTLPVVTISKPANGATVSGNVTISASATDNVAVASLQIYIDNSLYASTSSNSMSTAWNTNPKRLHASTHTITVKATDAAGNTGTKSIVVTVQ